MAGNPRKSANPAFEATSGQNRHREANTLLSNGKVPSVRKQAPNSRHRWTDHISGEKAIDLVEATAHAITIKRPLNLFVTIHFEKADLSPGWREQHAIGEWLKRAGQWLGLRGIPNTFLWILEHATGTGLHVHLLLHCPPEYRSDFTKKGKKDWLTKAGMAPTDRHAIHYEPVGPRNYDPGTATRKQQGTYLRQVTGVLRYHLEGIDPDGTTPTVITGGKLLAEMLRIEPKYSNPIYGRRVSRSQNIGKTARDRYHADRAGQAVKGLAG